MTVHLAEENEHSFVLSRKKTMQFFLIPYSLKFCLYLSILGVLVDLLFIIEHYLFKFS